jgi:hypothetical protein
MFHFGNTQIQRQLRMHDPENRDIGAPDGYKLVSVISVGYPAEPSHESKMRSFTGRRSKFGGSTTDNHVVYNRNAATLFKGEC